jgi:hypothetical protein
VQSAYRGPQPDNSEATQTFIDQSELVAKEKEKLRKVEEEAAVAIAVPNPRESVTVAALGSDIDALEAKIRALSNNSKPAAAALSSPVTSPRDSNTRPSTLVERLRKQCEERDKVAQQSEEESRVPQRSLSNGRLPKIKRKDSQKVIDQLNAISGADPVPAPAVAAPAVIKSVPIAIPTAAPTVPPDPPSLDRNVLNYQLVTHADKIQSPSGRKLTTDEMMQTRVNIAASTVLGAQEADAWTVQQYEKTLEQQRAAAAAAELSSSSSTNTSSTPSPVSSIAIAKSVVPAAVAATAAASAPSSFVSEEQGKILESLMHITQGAVCEFGWKCWRSNPCGGGAVQARDKPRYTHERGIKPYSAKDLFQYHLCIAFLRRCTPNPAIRTSSDLILPLVKQYAATGLRKHPLECAQKSLATDTATDTWLRRELERMREQRLPLRPIKKGIFMLAAIYLDGFVDLDEALGGDFGGPHLQLRILGKISEA